MGNGRARAEWIGGSIVIVALLVVLVGMLGVGSLSSLHHKSHTASVDLTPVASTQHGVTTTTAASLLGRSYAHGDCVTWDDNAAGERVTTVVPCNTPHVIEIGGSIDAADFTKTEPTDAQWLALFDAHCGRFAEELVGGPVDPHGRFAVNGLNPTHESWLEGERTVWCGVEASAIPGSRVPKLTDRVFTRGRRSCRRWAAACRATTSVPCRAAVRTGTRSRAS